MGIFSLHPFYLIVFDLSYNMRKKENENEFSSVFKQDFIRYDGKEKARVFKENETIVAIRELQILDKKIGNERREADQKV